LLTLFLAQLALLDSVLLYIAYGDADCLRLGYRGALQIAGTGENRSVDSSTTLRQIHDPYAQQASAYQKRNLRNVAIVCS
jgi:hypothetical protein